MHKKVTLKVIFSESCTRIVIVATKKMIYSLSNNTDIHTAYIANGQMQSPASGRSFRQSVGGSRLGRQAVVQAVQRAGGLAFV